MRGIADILANFHWIAPGEAARAAQVHGRLLGPFLEKRGVKGVINLRGRHPSIRWWQREVAACARHGIAHRDAMLDSRLLPLPPMLADLLDAFARTPRPFLIKCSGGQDRTSLAAALFLLWRDGWQALPQAEAQFAALPYLHLPKPEQRWLRQFPRFAAERAAGMDFSQWIQNKYEVEDFVGWLLLTNPGMPYAGIFPRASLAYHRRA